MLCRKTILVHIILAYKEKEKKKQKSVFNFEKNNYMITETKILEVYGHQITEFRKLSY